MDFYIADEDQVTQLSSKLHPKAQVLAAGSENWRQVLKSFNKDSQNQTPSLYVKCVEQKDIQQCLKFSLQNNLSLTLRSGCHNLGNFSLIQGGLVIDVKGLNSITHSQNKETITYQTGCRFGQLDEYINKNLPGYAFVTTMDPSIGTAGARCALGVGWLQRLIGNGIDNIVSLKIILWDGTIVTANQNNNKDLFMAVRGAGSNYGVVIQITQRIHYILDPAQGDEVLYSFHFYDIQNAQQTYNRIHKICIREDLPDSVFILPVLHYVNGKRGMSIITTHYKYDTQSKKIDKSVHWVESELRKIQIQCKGLPINELGDQTGWAYVSHSLLQQKGMRIPWGFNFYPCGGFVQQGQVEFVTSQLIRSWKQSDIPQYAKQVPFHSTAFYHFGGKKQRNRVPNQSAWPGNKDTRLLTVTWGGWKSPEQKQSMISWVKNQWKGLYKHLQFGYICAAAYDWKSQSYAKFVYGQNYKQLQKVKGRYDPHNTFRHNVNILPLKE